MYERCPHCLEKGLKNNVVFAACTLGDVQEHNTDEQKEAVKCVRVFCAACGAVGQFASKLTMRDPSKKKPRRRKRKDKTSV